MRALGANRRWARVLTHWQATLVAAGVLVLAIPIGLFAGALVYRAFVDRIGGQTVVTFPYVAIAAIALGLLLLANLAAVLPARRLRRASPAADLAAE
jgi:predicted lysophospholipase L1 biosynthesis ABC-type transport system permease subunit